MFQPSILCPSGRWFSPWGLTLGDRRRLVSLGAVASGVWLGLAIAAEALPPPEEIPEEVLRTEIITDGRSPISGEVLSAAEYAQLEADLQRADIQQAPDSFRSLIFLLQVRRVIQPVLPLLP
jgi:hypothetical protein